jgi:isochorismate hydrolase
MNTIRYFRLAIIVFFIFMSNCSENSSPVYLSDKNEIDSFVIQSHSLKGDVDNNEKSVRIKITPEINRSDLTPTIQVSKGASIIPPSGIPQDFTDTLIYTVTAEDKSIANYKVYTNVRSYILNSCMHIVHMQKYFINELGIHNSNSVISAIDSILQSAREEHIPIVFSKSQPAGNREIIDELEPLGTETVIESTSDQPVIDAINALNVKNVVVVGILTHACIKDICIELHAAGYNVFLVKNATSVLQSQDINLIENTCLELEQNGTVQLLLSNEIIF